MTDDARAALNEMREVLDRMLSFDIGPIVRKLEEIVKLVAPKASADNSPQKCIQGIQRKEKAYKGIVSKGKAHLAELEKDPTNREAFKALTKISPSDVDDRMIDPLSDFDSVYAPDLLRELAEEWDAIRLQIQTDEEQLQGLLEGYDAEVFVDSEEI